MQLIRGINWLVLVASSVQGTSATLTRGESAFIQRLSRNVSPVIQSLPLYLKKGGTKKKKNKGNTISLNKLAFRNYEVLETLEVGIALQGTEVKSIRNGKMNIRDGFVKPNKNGRSCTLNNVHIGKHSTAGEFFQHDERRPRTLLLHKQEARRLLQKTDKLPGMTIVPLKAYWSEQNKVKFEIGLCRGKNVRDKRQDIQDREGKREADRMIKNFNIR